MPTFHHVNLGVLEDQADPEGDFLVDVLGYRRVPEEERPVGLGVRWFRADDGSEVHLSVDDGHRPAAKAHVAVTFGAGLGGVGERLRSAGVDCRAVTGPGGLEILICRDPAGNLWELRGAAPSAGG